MNQAEEVVMFSLDRLTDVLNLALLHVHPFLDVYSLFASLRLQTFLSYSPLPSRSTSGA